MGPEAGTERSRAVVALTAACAFWGLSFPVTKAMSLGALAQAPGISSWFVSAVMVGGRFLVAAVVVTVLARTAPRRAEVVQGVLLGFSTGVGMLFQTDALSYTNASIGAFLTQGYVVLLPIVGAIRTRRAPELRVVICATLVLVGLAILAQFDPRSLTLGRGETETLLAAVCFTAQILLLDAKSFADNRPSVVSALMFYAIAAILLPMAAASARSFGDLGAVFASRGAPGLAVAIVVLPTLGSFLLMNRFQPSVPASEAGIIYATEPVFTSALALFLPAMLSRLAGIVYPNEVLEARLLVGGVLVVGANVLLAVMSPKGG
jgi:drug/metabolite transporter (DMT)-like permease